MCILRFYPIIGTVYCIWLQPHKNLVPIVSTITINPIIQNDVIL